MFVVSSSWALVYGQQTFPVCQKDSRLLPWWARCLLKKAPHSTAECGPWQFWTDVFKVTVSILCTISATSVSVAQQPPKFARSASMRVGGGAFFTKGWHFYSRHSLAGAALRGNPECACTSKPPVSNSSLHIFSPVLPWRKSGDCAIILPVPFFSSNGLSCSMGTILPSTFDITLSDEHPSDRTTLRTPMINEAQAHIDPFSVVLLLSLDCVRLVTCLHHQVSWRQRSSSDVHMDLHHFLQLLLSLPQRVIALGALAFLGRLAPTIRRPFSVDNGDASISERTRENCHCSKCRNCDCEPKEIASSTNCLQRHRHCRSNQRTRACSTLAKDDQLDHTTPPTPPIPDH